MRPESISNEFPSGLTSTISPLSSERTLRNPLSSSPIIVALNDDLFERHTVTKVLLINIYNNMYYYVNFNTNLKKNFFFYLCNQYL